MTLLGQLIERSGVNGVVVESGAHPRQGLRRNALDYIMAILSHFGLVDVLEHMHVPHRKLFSELCSAGHCWGSWD
jgi:hypothetical protein